MDFILVGMNHNTAPVEVRESVVFNEEDIEKALNIIKKDNLLTEGMIVSTCNRTEFIGANGQNNGVEKYVRSFLNDFKGVDYFTDNKYSYAYKGEDVVRHLFRVISGLDSMIVGETQIFGQIKNAYGLSYEFKANSILMNKLLHWAFKVGKRVRSQTEIGVGAVSVSLAAVELAQKIFKDLSLRKAFLIGAGETGELAAKHLKKKGIGEFFITNRTFLKAESVAGNLGGEAFPFEMIEEILPKVDIVISSTGSSGNIIDNESMKKCMNLKGNNPVFIIDIAVPRDFPKEISEIENVFLHDIDDLRVIVDKNLKKRKAEIPKAEKIIEEEIKNFSEWYKSIEFTPVIKLLFDKFEDIRRYEFSHHKKKFLKEDWKQLDLFTRHFINTLLHEPISRIKSYTDNKQMGFLMLDVIKELFDLDKK